MDTIFSIPVAYVAAGTVSPPLPVHSWREATPPVTRPPRLPAV